MLRKSLTLVIATILILAVCSEDTTPPRQEYHGYISSYNPVGAYRIYYPEHWTKAPQGSGFGEGVNAYGPPGVDQVVTVSSMTQEDTIEKVSSEVLGTVTRHPRYVPGSFSGIDDSTNRILAYSYMVTSNLCPKHLRLTNRVIFRDPASTVSEYPVIRLQAMRCVPDSLAEDVEVQVLSRFEYW